MTHSLKLIRLTAVVGALLVPLSVPAESSLGEQGRRATAHLMFKIVIPQVLSVEIGETLGVGGNHSLALLAAGGFPGHHIILSGSGHRSVAQFADCSRARPGDTAAMSCTVSML